MKDSIIYSIDKYVLQNEELLKSIIRDRDKDKDMIINAHKIVRQFIINRKLIIFGGLAIDYALRLKGSSIYYDDDLPDYDCRSCRSVDDAYDLGEILNDAGFENVKVIRAKHAETMRVRIDLITVADIGYIPDKYFKQYKYLTYNQLRILHPDIQRLDLHIAFCFPLNNAPMEDIFHRWEKDFNRFNLYEKYYPIKENNMSYKIKNYSFDLPDVPLFAFHGFAAFALFRKEVSKYPNIESQLNIPLLYINITGNKCKLDIPVSDHTLHLTTSEEYITDINRFNNILDILPTHTLSNNVCMYYVNLLSITTIDNFNVVNVQYLLMWLLFHYNFSDNISDRQIYGNFYIYTLQMVDKLAIFNPTLSFLGAEKEYKPLLQNNNYPINYTPSKTGTRHQFNYSNFTMSGEKVNEK